MKHKNSILICQMDDGSLNLFVNGTQVLVGEQVVTPVNKIANCDLSFGELRIILEQMKFAVAGAEGRAVPAYPVA
jgi:hypothetical protein